MNRLRCNCRVIARIPVMCGPRVEPRRRRMTGQVRAARRLLARFRLAVPMSGAERPRDLCDEWLEVEAGRRAHRDPPAGLLDSRSEEHTSELQSLMRISYAVFCLKK